MPAAPFVFIIDLESHYTCIISSAIDKALQLINAALTLWLFYHTGSLWKGNEILFP